MDSGLWEEIVGSPLILVVIIGGLIGLGLYGNWRKRREK